MSTNTSGVPATVQLTARPVPLDWSNMTVDGLLNVVENDVKTISGQDFDVYDTANTPLCWGDRFAPGPLPTFTPDAVDLTPFVQVTGFDQATQAVSYNLHGVSGLPEGAGVDMQGSQYGFAAVIPAAVAVRFARLLPQNADYWMHVPIEGTELALIGFGMLD